MTAYRETPAWVADAVFYQIFPDRFASSDRVSKPGTLEPWDATPTPHGFKGGDLGGVIEHLDHLERLGVNAILFNPIFQSASNHRYHTHDYFKIDPLLGDEALFDELLEACHERGIRVVLDGVFNHCSRGFFQFNDILENGAQSPYLDWFDVRDFPIYPYHPSQQEDPSYEAWRQLPALPTFNTDNELVREYLFSAVEYWTRKGIDGWRLDVPAEITTPGFWQEFRQRVRRINSEAYIVAEIWEDSSAWLNNRDQFDGTMNYLYTASVISFAAGARVDPALVAGQPWSLTTVDAAGLAKEIERLLSLYDDQATLGNLTTFSSHDTSRILTMVGDDEASVRLILLLALTFPGAAHIYYGEELGMRGGPDPLSRGAVLWEDQSSWNTGLLGAFQELIALRKELAPLRSLDYRILATDGMVFAAERRAASDRLVVIANAGDEAAGVAVGGSPTPLWGDVSIDEAVATVPPRSGALIAL